MTRISTSLGIFALAVLAGCTSEPVDNVQQRAENASGQIEQRADELEAEADNRTLNAAATLENQAKALELEGNEAAPANSVAIQTTNAQ
jgi:hypothetical protein